jgi:hypothetical protein
MTQAIYKLVSKGVENATIYPIEGDDYYFLAIDENEVDLYVKKGWALSTNQAKGVKNEKQVQTEGQREISQEVSKKQLWAKLDTQGVQYDKRWSIERLQGLVNVD